LGLTLNACPVNCSYTTYQGGSCSVSCGGGNYATYYTKTVVESGGGTCPISEGQFAGYSGGACNTQACPVNCSYTTYQGGSCSVSCGGGNYATYYTKTVVESGGGTCPISEGQFAGYSGGACNTQSCSYTLNLTIASSTQNYNLRTAAIAAGWDGVTALAVTVTVNA
jgi:hypothetical protein